MRHIPHLTRPALASGLVLAALCVSPKPARGQRLVGRVLTEGGSPLPAAAVEVWGHAVVLYVTSSGPGGWFSVPDLHDRGVTRYVFRYLGRQVQIVQQEDFHDGRVIRLGLAPDYSLSGLTVTVRRRTCPNVDDPAARARWAEAAAMYNQSTSGRGIGGSYRGTMEDVKEDDLFLGIDGAIGPTAARWNGWPAGVRKDRGRVRSLESVVRTMGYAWRRKLDGPEQFLGRDPHLDWLYAELEGRSANHFATGTFGDLHTFSFLEKDDSGARLQFCPERGGSDLPTVRGTILIDRDGHMVEAEWRFTTGDPDEEAGGWVRFEALADRDGGLPHLVAERGMFYRRSTLQQLYSDQPRWDFRDLRAWSRWVLSPGPSEPLRGSAQFQGGRRPER